jgi:hypothetical protein
VSTVIALGFLRPVILFPVGLLNQLTAKETEAILLHELAHISRNDHRWVVVQQLVRDLFFYHPLVYWLDSQLDREREFACDDRVQQHIPREVYAQALLRVARFSQSLHPSAIPQTVSATTSIRQRLQRMFPQSGLPSRSWSYPYPSVALLVGVFVLFSGTFSWAQTPAEAERAVVQGRVLDASTLQPLIGTSVLRQGTDIGTVTDMDGQYALALSPGQHTLVFSYVGYPNRTTTVLVDGNTKLDILLAKTEDADTITPDDALRGGTRIMSNSDNILYIVNGERFEGSLTNDIAAEDIESVSVFKKAENMAKFGYGTDFDGVIEIKLKAGRKVDR